jgi:hypothetical protein
MATSIVITPPGGIPYTVAAYQTCKTTLSVANRAGSFSLILPKSTSDLIDAFPYGSDVRIDQDGHIFRGWVLNPAKNINGPVKYIELSGPCYTGRTQKILVNEDYTNQTIDFIIKDLFTKNYPEINLESVVACTKVITIQFRDQFLFNCIENLCQLAGGTYNWYISEPMPVTVDPGLGEAGWSEKVDIFSCISPRPADDLYPGENLFPG